MKTTTSKKKESQDTTLFCSLSEVEKIKNSLIQILSEEKEFISLKSEEFEMVLTKSKDGEFTITFDCEIKK